MAETIDHNYWMGKALDLAHKAADMGEVPVGALVVLDNQIIGEGFNQPIGLNDPSAHAEIQALRQAANTLGNYRLINTQLYVTLEPCVMCVGAMVHARVADLIYGASDPKTGMVSSCHQLFELPEHNHKVNHIGGILEEECSQLLKAFFKSRRLSSNRCSNSL